MSTKINVRSPFSLKYQASNLVYVELDIYVYAGQKTTDKGDVRYSLKKYPISGNDYVIFELAEIVRDYLKPNNNLLANNVSDCVKWVQIEDSIVTEYIPDCTYITGFAVAQDGTISYPTSTSGTLTIRSINFENLDNPGTGTSIASYNANTTGSAVTRTARVNIAIPSGNFNSGQENALCVVTADQPSS